MVKTKRAGRMASGGVIREAATALFLRSGYLGTSMEDIATLAGVSKQTVYTHFADKERLFADLVMGATDRAEEFITWLAAVLPESSGVEEDLRQVARRYLRTVLQPELLQLRRLVIGESGRFPELARSYYERAPGRTLTALASAFERLGERGLLRVDDPALAARHFAFLVVGAAMDRAMFCGDEQAAGAELDRQADAAVSVFVAAYAS